MRIDPPTGLWHADITKVSRPYRVWRDNRWHHYRTITVRCPHCRSLHTHEWAAADPEPGVRFAHCTELPPYCRDHYYVPAPGPDIPIPGICRRPTKSGTACTRTVPREGLACNQHRLRQTGRQ